MHPAIKPQPAVETSTASPAVEVSVVLPCLNERDAIGAVVARALAGIRSTGRTGEVVVVDNGSLDDTAAVAARAGARVVLEQARGYGNAVRRGFAEARGRYIVMADGDGTYPVETLQPFIARLEAGDDMVYGNRFRGSIQPGAMPWTHRYVGTPLLSWLLRLLTHANVSDSQCGMRAFRRETLRRLDLRAPGMELNAEMLAKAGRHGLRIGEVAIPLEVRIGESKLQTVPDGWRNLRYLLVASPDQLFLLPGATLFVLGLLALLLQALFPGGIDIGNGNWRPAYASVVLGATGAQTLWFGIIAKLFHAATHLSPSSRLATWLLESFSLERALAFSLALMAVGLGLELALGIQQFGLIGYQPALAPAGAFALVIGLQSFFSAFLAYLLRAELPRT